ncbi:hypothetical protein BESB_061370 [Besnoitia besnoiti]|uniref:Uncharacterized protein n=1 Tax=Besnoitia besnoiti TaxID=94643 RepID=A0A2A9MIM1_BESBE|nr:hypothetical protein BESB_061370 [Besnoitia besnoiti]PFH35250.1 hypothetical protein BESB_061370 [Besnoitia besnoiti]
MMSEAGRDNADAGARGRGEEGRERQDAVQEGGEGRLADRAATQDEKRRKSRRKTAMNRDAGRSADPSIPGGPVGAVESLLADIAASEKHHDLLGETHSSPGAVPASRSGVTSGGLSDPAPSLLALPITDGKTKRPAYRTRHSGRVTAGAAEEFGAGSKRPSAATLGGAFACDSDRGTAGSAGSPSMIGARGRRLSEAEKSCLFSDTPPSELPAAGACGSEGEALFAQGSLREELETVLSLGLLYLKRERELEAPLQDDAASPVGSRIVSVDSVERDGDDSATAGFRPLREEGDRAEVSANVAALLGADKLRAEALDCVALSLASQPDEAASEGTPRLAFGTDLCRASPTQTSRTALERDPGALRSGRGGDRGRVGSRTAGASPGASWASETQPKGMSPEWTASARADEKGEARHPRSADHNGADVEPKETRRGGGEDGEETDTASERRRDAEGVKGSGSSGTVGAAERRLGVHYSRYDRSWVARYTQGKTSEPRRASAALSSRKGDADAPLLRISSGRRCTTVHDRAVNLFGERLQGRRVQVFLIVSQLAVDRGSAGDKVQCAMLFRGCSGTSPCCLGVIPSLCPAGGRVLKKYFSTKVYGHELARAKAVAARLQMEQQARENCASASPALTAMSLPSQPPPACSLVQTKGTGEQACGGAALSRRDDNDPPTLSPSSVCVSGSLTSASSCGSVVESHTRAPTPSSGSFAADSRDTTRSPTHCSASLPNACLPSWMPVPPMGFPPSPGSAQPPCPLGSYPFPYNLSPCPMYAFPMPATTAFGSPYVPQASPFLPFLQHPSEKAGAAFPHDELGRAAGAIDERSKERDHAALRLRPEKGLSEARAGLAAGKDDEKKRQREGDEDAKGEAGASREGESERRRRLNDSTGPTGGGGDEKEDEGVRLEDAEGAQSANARAGGREAVRGSDREGGSLGLAAERADEGEIRTARTSHEQAVASISSLLTFSPYSSLPACLDVPRCKTEDTVSVLLDRSAPLSPLRTERTSRTPGVAVPHAKAEAGMGRARNAVYAPGVPPVLPSCLPTGFPFSAYPSPFPPDAVSPFPHLSPSSGAVWPPALPSAPGAAGLGNVREGAQEAERVRAPESEEKKKSAEAESSGETRDSEYPRKERDEGGATETPPREDGDAEAQAAIQRAADKDDDTKGEPSPLLEAGESGCRDSRTEAANGVNRERGTVTSPVAEERERPGKPAPEHASGSDPQSSSVKKTQKLRSSSVAVARFPPAPHAFASPEGGALFPSMPLASAGLMPPSGVFQAAHPSVSSMMPCGSFFFPGAPSPCQNLFFPSAPTTHPHASSSSLFHPSFMPQCALPGPVAAPTSPNSP